MQQRVARVGMGPIPNYEQIAEELLKVIDEVYRERYRASQPTTFGAIKKAVDHALDGLRARGTKGIADRIHNEIAHEYLMKHRYQRMPALPAFQKAADEVLQKLKDGLLM